MTTGKNIRCGEPVRLDNREALSLPRQPSCREIVCTEGVIWVTFPGDPLDYLLKRGERLTVGRGGEAVVSAIGKAVFCLTEDDDVPDRPVRQDLTRTHAA